MPEITIIAISILAFCVSLLSLMLLIIEYKKSNQTKEKEAKLELQKAEDKSKDIIADAVKKAQTIISQAETDQLNVVNTAQQQTQKLEQAAEKEFASSSQIGKQELEKEIKALTANVVQAQNIYLSYLNDLKVQMGKNQQDNMELVKQQINSIFERFEQNLADFLTTTEQKSVMTIELELRATRQLIENYKQQQLKLIDENLVAVLETTLTKVLSKKLTLKDQTDLVYEALEKAKVEKFIV